MSPCTRCTSPGRSSLSGMLTYHDHRRAGPTRRLVEVASRCTIGQPAALAALATEVRVTSRKGEYHASWGGTYTAASLLEAGLDGAPGDVRRDAHSSSVVPTPAGGERRPLTCCAQMLSFPNLGYVTPNPTHVVTVPCLDASRRETPAAMATIERINSSSSLLAGMTLLRTQDPVRGPSHQSD